MTISPLRIERIKRGKTQVHLWQETGVPQWRISLIERGIPPKPDEAEKLAHALGVNVPDIFPGEETCQ